MSPPPSANSKNSMKNRVTQSVQIFVYKTVTQIILLFAKCLDFVYKKPNVTQSVMLFVYK